MPLTGTPLHATDWLPGQLTSDQGQQSPALGKRQTREAPTLTSFSQGDQAGPPRKRVRAWSATREQGLEWCSPEQHTSLTQTGLVLLKEILARVVRAATYRMRNKATLDVELTNMECMAMSCVWDSVRLHATRSSDNTCSTDVQNDNNIHAQTAAWMFLAANAETYFAELAVDTETCLDIATRLAQATRTPRCEVYVEQVWPVGLGAAWRAGPRPPNMRSSCFFII